MSFILPCKSVKKWQQRQVQKQQKEEIEKPYTANPVLYSVNNLLLTDPKKLKRPEWHGKPGSSVDFPS